MRKIFILSFSSISIFLLACGSSHTEQKASAMATDTLNNTAAVSEKKYDIAIVNNKKDPTCGMPVTAGIGDTAHYENKVIGFCSSECKMEFLKNPKATIAAAGIK